MASYMSTALMNCLSLLPRLSRLGETGLGETGLGVPWEGVWGRGEEAGGVGLKLGPDLELGWDAALRLGLLGG